MSRKEKQKSASAQPPAEIPEFYVVTLGTRHYDWMGVGLTEEDAMTALKVRFFEQNELDEVEWLAQMRVDNWEEFMATVMHKVRPGEGYLDSEDTDDYQRRMKDV